MADQIYEVENGNREGAKRNMKHMSFSSLSEKEYFTKLSVYGQAMDNLSSRLSRRIPKAHLSTFSDEVGKHDAFLSYEILKQWISQDKYNFDDIYPVSFSELIRAVELGIKEYKKEFGELSFLFDNSIDWNVEDAYRLIYASGSGRELSGVAGIEAATKLAGNVIKTDKPYWSIWRMSLKYVTSSAKRYLYKLYDSRGVKLKFDNSQRMTLTRWLYELARFPAGTISPGLLYKKIMLSQMFDRERGRKHISSGMNEGILYNLCFNLHASGLQTFYFGNYLDREPKLNRSCHNSLAAKKRYIDISISITSLLERQGRIMVANSLEIEGESNIYMAVITNYQIIIIGVDPKCIMGLDREKCRHLSRELLVSCLEISGFSFDDARSIYCKKENGFKSLFIENEVYRSDYDLRVQVNGNNVLHDVSGQKIVFF